MTARPSLPKLLLSVLACLLIALVPAVGAAPPAQAILYGEDSADTVGAVQVLLSNEAAFCTGTLINPGWVLTARHCVTDNSAQPATTEVFLGDLRFRQGERHDVQEIFNHPTADAALLHLTTRTEQIELVQPYGVNDPRTGTPASIRGWGATQANPSRPASTLQVGSNTVAAVFEGSTMELTSTDGSKTQNGDSGGPVSIFGLTCGLHSSTSFLTSTAVKTNFLAPWITATANVLPGGACDLDLSKKKKAGLAHRIMAMGNAETVGSSFAGNVAFSGIGYRDFLKSMLVKAGLKSNFVGPNRAGPPPNDSLSTGDESPFKFPLIADVEEQAKCAVYDYAPDIVTLIVGENDISRRYDLSHESERLDSLISTIQQVSPRTVILVAPIVPEPAEDYDSSIVASYNASLKKLVTDRTDAGQHISYVDTSDLVIEHIRKIINHDYGDADGFSSGVAYPVNLTPSGFFKEAKAFNLAIDNAVDAGWIPDSLPLYKGPCNGTSSGKRDLRVMPLGSSTTYGIHSSDGNGYRKTLDDSLEQVVESKDPQTGGNNASGASTVGTQRLAVSAAQDAQDTTPRVDEVGSVDVGTMGDRDNEGWPRLRIDEISGKAKCAVPAYQPNLVTLLAGGNDVIQDYQMGTALSRLEALVTQIQDGSPAATVLVANMQRFREPAMDARGVAFSQTIPGMVDRLAGQGRHVLFVDTGQTPGDVSDDGIHPTDAGYVKIGRAFAQATSSAFDRGWIQAADPQAPNIADNPCGHTDGGANTRAPSGGNQVQDKRWEDHGVSFKDGFGKGNNYRWGDVNKDGKPELFVVKPDQSWTFYWNGGRTANGWTSWGKGFSRAAPGGGAVGNALRIADVDGDHEPDCVRVSLKGTISVSTWDDKKPVGQKLCGTPFKDGRLAAGPVKADTKIVFADIDGDKRDDYLLVQPRGTTNLWLNRKTGWIKGGQIAGPLGSARIRRWADIDHNGRADQILLTAKGGARAWLNEGISQNQDTGTLKVKLRDVGAIVKDSGLPPADLQFVDVGGDGSADLVRTGWTGVTHIWLNRVGLKPAATTDGPIRSFWEDHGVSFADGLGKGNTYQFGDVNGDGKVELFVAEPDQSWTFYWNSGPSATGWSGWVTGAETRPPTRPNLPGNQFRLANIDADGAIDCLGVTSKGGIYSPRVWNKKAPVGQKVCGTPSTNPDVDVPTGPIAPGTQIVFADLDADGIDEYLLVGADGATRAWRYGAEDAGGNKAPRKWRPLGQIAGPLGQDRVVRWADVNSDGRADQILITAGGGARAWINDGGIPDPGSTSVSPLAKIRLRDVGKIMDDKELPPSEMHFADMDGDGHADLVRIGWTGVTHIWLDRLPTSYFTHFHP